MHLDSINQVTASKTGQELCFIAKNSMSQQTKSRKYLTVGLLEA